VIIIKTISTINYKLPVLVCIFQNQEFDKGFQKQFSPMLKKIGHSYKSLNDGEYFNKGKLSSFISKDHEIYVLGLGNEDKLSNNIKRNIIGKAFRTLSHNKIKELQFLMELKSSDSKIVAEAYLLSAYKFEEYKSKKSKNTIGKLLLWTEDESISKKELKDARIECEGTILVRDLVNTPAVDLIPEDFSVIGEAIGEKYNIDVKVMSADELIKNDMNLLLGVSAGSPYEPKLLIMHYKNSDDAPTVLVGKGVTYDSGGTNLKPTGYLEDMKIDMAGAATVLGAIQTAARLKLKVNVYAIMPLTENIIGTNALKPGDVIKSASGQTVEILNTDAEGRLILADALNYATTLKPKSIIDLATLTGAALVALGDEIAPILGNNQDLINDLINSGEKVGEKLWPLPLPEEYECHIKSDIADMKNIGKPKGRAGTISAAIFLKRFVKSYNWAHIDIAGPAEAESVTGINIRGGTGFGVRLLVDYLKKLDN